MAILDLQFGYVDTVAAGAYVHIPLWGEANRLTQQDSFMNRYQRPLVVRNLSIYTGAAQSGPFPLRLLKTNKYVDGLYLTDEVEAMQLSNHVSPYLGDSRNFRLKLWKPVRLVQNDTLYVQVGGAATVYGVYDFATLTGTFAFAALAKGLKSGKDYEMGDSQRTTTGSYAKYIPNLRGEDLAITQFSMRGDASYPYPLVSNFGRGQQPIPFWMVADPFPYARISFANLPGGGMVLQPGEGLAVEGTNKSAATPRTLTMAWEAYVLEEGEAA